MGRELRLRGGDSDIVTDGVIVYSQLDPFDGAVGPPRGHCSDCLGPGGGEGTR